MSKLFDCDKKTIFKNIEIPETFKNNIGYVAYFLNNNIQITKIKIIEITEVELNSKKLKEKYVNFKKVELSFLRYVINKLSFNNFFKNNLFILKNKKCSFYSEDLLSFFYPEGFLYFDMIGKTKEESVNILKQCLKSKSSNLKQFNSYNNYLKEILK